MELYEICMIGISIVLLIACIYYGYNYFKNKTLDDIREDVYQLFLKAEHNFSSGEGAKKMNWVITKVHDMLPNWLQVFLSEETLRKIVQYWFDGIKDLLDDGKLNKSTEEKSEVLEEDSDDVD